MQKSYMIEWSDNWGIIYKDLIYARDKVDAWKKIKRRHPFTAKRLWSIEEID